MYLETSNPVTVHFRHHQTELLLPDGEVVEERITECHIHLGMCKEKSCGRGDLGTGAAICSYKDEFVKRIGRKISLTRALAKLPKETREEIWAKYFELAPRSKG